MQNILAICLCFLVVPIYGCQHLTSITKQQSGIGIGATAGAIFGTVLDNGKESIIFATVAGAIIGNQIGKYLDEKDKKKAAKASEEAVISGEKQRWENHDTNVSGSAEVIATHEESGQVRIPVLKDRIEQVPPLNLIGNRYKVLNNANLRVGPNKNYKVVSVLQAGEEIDVIGKVQDQPWFMVGQNQVGTGFIFETLLVPLKVSVTKQTVVNKKIDKTEISEQTVAVSRKCRTVHQVITLADGTSKEEDITACQGPNGWEMI